MHAFFNTYIYKQCYFNITAVNTTKHLKAIFKHAILIHAVKFVSFRYYKE